MFIFTLTVGILAFVFGLLLVFSYETLKAWSRMLSTSLWSEAWIARHRKVLGLVLLALAACLVANALRIGRLGAF